MFSRLKKLFTDESKRDLALTAGGMGALALGAGPFAALPFGLGIRGLEKQYRAKHDFEGTFSERWARSIKFYDGTHQDAMNKACHLVGMPFIVAGSAGLLVSSPVLPFTWPLYGASLASFAGGWTLNLAGHAVFEKNSPAFADDPLSFVAGPMWEIDLLRKKLTGVGRGEAAA